MDLNIFPLAVVPHSQPRYKDIANLEPRIVRQIQPTLPNIHRALGLLLIRRQPRVRLLKYLPGARSLYLYQVKRWELPQPEGL
jgi:hypothetical protein